jgi:hypothetical protein
MTGCEKTINCALLFQSEATVNDPKTWTRPWKVALPAERAGRRRHRQPPVQYQERIQLPSLSARHVVLLAHMTRVLLRLYLSSDRPLGPGKVQVLESIRDGGSSARRRVT